MSPVRAISLWQPWASLWVAGVKVHETRHWPTDYRGPLVVHAAKRPIDRYLGVLLEAVCENAFGVGWRRSGQVPLGALLGMVELVDCYPTEHCAQGGTPAHIVGSVDWRCGNFNPGRCAWRAAAPRAFSRPVPWKGKQGLFWVPGDVVEQGLRGQP